jgi:hypothetical protein
MQGKSDNEVYLGEGQMKEWYRSLLASKLLLENTGKSFFEAAHGLSDLDAVIPLPAEDKSMWSG